MNVVKEIERITEQELKHGIFGGSSASWHQKYKDSAWVYVGGLSYDLTEGDIICVMSQWGEVEDINLVRDKETNKSMGFAFLKYEDQRSTILAVDNFNGIKLLDRTLRCDHVDKYKLPKEVRQKEEEELEMNPNAEVKLGPGHAYKSQDLENHYDIASGIDLWARQQTSSPTEEPQRKHKKHKKEEKKHKKEKKRHRRDDESVAAVYVSSVEGGRALTRPDTAGSSTFATQLSGPAAAVDPNASWRGRMEPALRAQEESERRRVASGIEGGNRREEFDGFGGMKRRR